MFKDLKEALDKHLFTKFGVFLGKWFKCAWLQHVSLCHFILETVLVKPFKLCMMIIPAGFDLFTLLL